MQKFLAEYGMIKTICVPIKNYPYKTRIGLAERQLRNRLKKKGWELWRGGYINAISADIYPVVKRRYDQLAKIITDANGINMLHFLCYLCTVHHGMPDYVCYHKHTKQLKFVECKLFNEQLSQRQVKTILKLQEAGFNVEVHKLVGSSTKTREAETNILTKEKKIKQKEETLKKYQRIVL